MSKFDLSQGKFKWTEIWRICWDWNGKAMETIFRLNIIMFNEDIYQMRLKSRQFLDEMFLIPGSSNIFNFLFFVRKSMSR